MPQTQSPRQPPLFWDSYTGENYGVLHLSAARSFSEGVAWVTLNSGDHYQTMLIDETGHCLYQRNPASSEPDIMTNFAKGVGFISDEEGSAVVNTNGEVVFTDKDVFAKAESLLGEGSIEFFNLGTKAGSLGGDSPSEQLFNGHLVATIKFNTFEGSGTVKGLLNPDGSWLYEPSDAELTLSPDWEVAIVTEHENENYYEKAFNLKTGEIFDAGILPEDGLLMQQLLTNRPFDPIRHWVPELNDYYITLNISNAIPVSHWLLDSVLENTGGLIYDYSFRAFVDKDKTSIIDISEYSFMRHSGDEPVPAPMFKNGYCFLPLRNPDGDPYYTVIDEQGNRIFEPQKWAYDSDNGWAYITDDRFLQTDWIAPQLYAFAAASGSEIYYIDLATGQPFKDIGYDEMFPYVGDIALVYEESSNQYFYIDKDGNKLFQQENDTIEDWEE